MLSEATRKTIRDEVAKYPQAKTALLPSLKLAQREKGWLSEATLKEVAELVGLPHSHAVELATFYSMLFTEEGAPVRAEVCVQLPCSLAGAEHMAKQLASSLGAPLAGPVHKSHGHTQDHKIELHTTVECYGACHRAPMCRVIDPFSGTSAPDVYVENVKTSADVEALAAQLKARAAKVQSNKGAH